MKKLKLESLEVTSFETLAAEPGGRGTVQGHAKTVAPECAEGFSIYIECNYITSPLYNCTVDCTADANCVVDGGELQP